MSGRLPLRRVAVARLARIRKERALRLIEPEPAERRESWFAAFLRGEDTSSIPWPEIAARGRILKQRREKKIEELRHGLLEQLTKAWERHRAGRKRRRVGRAETPAEINRRRQIEADRKHFKRIVKELRALGVI